MLKNPNDRLDIIIEFDKRLPENVGKQRNPEANEPKRFQTYDPNFFRDRLRVTIRSVTGGEYKQSTGLMARDSLAKLIQSNERGTMLGNDFFMEKVLGLVPGSNMQLRIEIKKPLADRLQKLWIKLDREQSYMDLLHGISKMKDAFVDLNFRLYTFDPNKIQEKPLRFNEFPIIFGKKLQQKTKTRLSA